MEIFRKVFKMFQEKLHPEKIYDFYQKNDFDENHSFFNPKSVNQFFTYIEKDNTLRIEFDPKNIFKFDFDYEKHSLFEANLHCTSLSECLSEALGYTVSKVETKVTTSLEKKSTFPYFEIKRKYDKFSIEFDIKR